MRIDQKGFAYISGFGRLAWSKRIKHSQILTCNKCGKKYIYMAKHKGKCYLHKKLCVTYK